MPRDGVWLKCLRLNALSINNRQVRRERRSNHKEGTCNTISLFDSVLMPFGTPQICKCIYLNSHTPLVTPIPLFRLFWRGSAPPSPDFRDVAAHKGTQTSPPYRPLDYPPFSPSHSVHSRNNSCKGLQNKVHDPSLHRHPVR